MSDQTIALFGVLGLILVVLCVPLLGNFLERQRSLKNSQLQPNGLSMPRIVCAACYSPKLDIMLLGPRHFDASMHRALAYHQNLTNAEEDGFEQGFIDQHGVFHNRQNAWKIAVANNQIIRRCGGDSAHGGTLYSENLY